MTSTARIRVAPEDFVVEEIPLQTPQGDGQHLWLWIEKRLCTTDRVIDDLARGLQVPSREIGYAGRKDRRAVTGQWMSIPAHLEAALAELQLDGADIVRAVRHPQRLRLGELRGNRFCLRIRHLSESSYKTLVEALASIEERGLPNRFGRQRFGKDGHNAERGADMLRRRRLKGPRRQAFLMLSALQSTVFNRVLEARAETFDRLLSGDIALLHGSGELLQVNDPEALEERRRRLEASATGPIFGTKMRWPRGEVMAMEEAAMEALDLPPMRRLDLPRNFKLYGDRRPLRVPVRDIHHERLDEDLILRFELPPGSYATVLLEELLPEGFEEGPDVTPTGGDAGVG